ncbi:toluene tolerance protein [Aliarcobacter trophiarum LMG 25534]|uniref:Lipid asymmetry ABC transporter MlaABCDEF, periplasmic component MlaC n=1 Tax=Aliarcobacter trophiarum LMG 25534 TaxID=1032241 RepID=A0AAD0QKC5_9BACT|nr:ABC transporter substrate-binding protein [Aliarcobacter trophiarum]AXK49026.1 lipid asymmetry ABC transporter MlaABCDEF, periplasmic component MlaC [Aliarcobacter trophiarum LMG 25534]RXI27333.1 toluene tolerance protein [Aliarcobacter trophiarum]RXJ89893.1 toluene tolerance protein [Aliarcobacter trophiarum LMG 25534]
MKNSLLKLLLLLLVIFSSSHALQKDEIKEEMAKKIDSVLLILKDSNIAMEDKKKEIINIVNDTFDFKLMARIALGSEAWNSLDIEKQKEFSEVFEEKLKKSYTDKLELYNNQKVKILGLEPYNNTRLQLKTELVGKEGNYSINYNFYEKNGEWLIYDIDLIGVSIIQTYRQQFAGLLKEKSFNEMFTQFKNQ